MSATILLVDDQPEIAEMVVAALKKGGYRVKHKETADSALKHLREELPDLVLLDVELPGVSGFDVLDIIRREERTAGLPVIMLTVMSTQKHKVRGLESGADDYITKPFSGEELRARVAALLRRSQAGGKKRNVIDVGVFHMDVDGRELTVNGKRIILTPGEFEVMFYLLQQPGAILATKDLASSLSKANKEVTSDGIYTHVKNLRVKLGKAGSSIETAYGIGYKFVPAR